MTSSNKQKKINQVKSLASLLAEAKSSIFIDFSGMNVKAQEELRNTLREAGGKMIIAKNTLLKLAGKKAKLPKESLTDTVLTGQTALIYSVDDPVSPIQVLGKFINDNELPKIKAGNIDGNCYDEAGVIKISKLPNKDVLQAQVVGSISAPLHGLINVIQGNMKNFVSILSQIKSQNA